MSKHKNKITAKPFLKWVGGKRLLLPELLARAPSSYSDYYEPFVGGGAFFFALRPRRARLSDANPHLILAYRAVRDSVEELITMLRVHKRKHSRAYFFHSCKRFAAETDPVAKAALLIYLNKSCYNGIYRLRKMGEYGASIGNSENPPIPGGDILRADSAALRGVRIQRSDFTRIKPKRDAFYFFDPPYHRTHDDFYGSNFGEDSHQALAGLCKEIDQAGGRFLLSNSDTEFVRSLYESYNIEQVPAPRSVSGGHAVKIDLLVRNYTGLTKTL